jgi:hypothetical protein
MPARSPVARTKLPVPPRLSPVERRAAQAAAMATRQAELKDEAAQRRTAREQDKDPPATPHP